VGQGYEQQGLTVQVELNLRNMNRPSIGGVIKEQWTNYNSFGNDKSAARKPFTGGVSGIHG
jgi:hypothetical protein